MGKKGTKRKTTWRALSIDSVEDATSQTNGSTEPNSEQVSPKDNKYPNSSYLRRKPLFNSSSNVRNDSRGDYPRSYYKQNSTLSSSSSYSSRTSYHRRPFQNSGSRFFNYRTGRTQYNRNFDANKENSEGRPHFNEEYTRITTPRQDVIFKKGYLSQPRKYLSSTDTNTTSSAAASIVSTEESISAASVPSLSPEQCSSYADSVDPEQAFMYSYFDQNGIFYINPCLPNGFDQYSGQMFMLPYSYPPYSVYPSDLNSPMQSTDVEETPTSTDSNENLSDQETNIKETTDKMEKNCDSKPEPEGPEKAAEDKEENAGENAESITEDTEQTEINNAPFQNFYNCGYHPYYPPVFLPYVYGQQFVPVMPEAGTSQPCDECSEDGIGEEDNSKKEDDAMQTNSDENSSGATTMDCSKEDCNNKLGDARVTVVDETSCDTAAKLNPASNQETESKSVFNANAEEFIPRLHRTHLNVNVKEFLPSNYTSTESAASSSENDSLSLNLETKEDAPEKVSVSIIEEKGSQEEPPKEQRKTAVKKNQINLSPSENIKDESNLTLAERIKKEMAKETVHSEKSKSSPPKSSSTNLVSKKNPKRNEKKITNSKTPMSFAQMLTNSNQKVTKIAASPTATVSINTIDKIAAKETAKSHVLESKINEPKLNTAAEKTAVQDEWQTVKVKGKRRHLKENAVVEEIVEKVKSSEVHAIEKAAETVSESVKTVPEYPTGEQTTQSANKAKTPPAVEVPEENLSTADPVVDEAVKPATSLSSSEKKNKSRNKKQKKCPNSSSGKKTKDREIVKESSESKSNEKSGEKHTKNNPRPIEVEDVSKARKSLFVNSGSSEEDLTLESLYLLDSKNYLLTKNYSRNPLDLLNGFDCKFKGNNVILKEEEEMVLSVIKSLSTNQPKQQEVRGPFQDSLSDTETQITSVDAKDDVRTENVDVSDRGEELTETCESRHNVSENRSDSDFEMDKKSNQVADIAHTIVQALSENIVNSVSQKIWHPDPNSDSFEKGQMKESPEVMTDVSDLVKVNTLEQSQENSHKEISFDEQSEKSDADCIDETLELPQNAEVAVEKDDVKESPATMPHVSDLVEVNSLEQSQENYQIIDEKSDADCIDEALELLENTEVAVSFSLVANNEHFNEDGSDNKEASSDDNCDTTFTATPDHSASLLQDSTEMNVLSFNGCENSSSDPNDSDSFQIDLLKYKPKKSSEEKLDIKQIFEAKMREIEDHLNKSSSSASCTSKEETVAEEDFLEECLTMDPGTLQPNVVNEENAKNPVPPEEVSTKNSSPQSSKNESGEKGLDGDSGNVSLIGASLSEFATDTNAFETTNSDGMDSGCEIFLENNHFEEESSPEKPALEENAPTTGTEPTKEPLTESVETPQDFEETNCVHKGECNRICSKIVQCEPSSLVVSLVNNEECGESDDQNSSCVSPLSSSRANTSFTTITSDEGRIYNGHLDENSTSDYHSSNEVHDSKEAFKKDYNSEEVESNSAVISETNPDSIDDPKKYPLTMAVKQWLISEAKEETPEPIFRIPDDPKLNSIITSSIIERVERNKECDNWTTSEESDDEDIVKRPKNLQSNPSRVSSVNSLLRCNRKNQQNDTDSDYNSDGQQRYDDDDNTCERVAKNPSDTPNSDKNDLLDYWDDDFIRDPKKWLDAKRRDSEENESVFSSTPSEQLVSYDSVYGKSIDYNRLLASNYEFLSNNIISFNETNADEKPHAKVDDLTSGTMLKNNFGNVNGKNTCMKPLEVCCIIM